MRLQVVVMLAQTCPTAGTPTYCERFNVNCGGPARRRCNEGDKILTPKPSNRVHFKPSCLLTRCRPTAANARLPIRAGRKQRTAPIRKTLDSQKTAAIVERNTADKNARKAINLIVNSVKGDPEEGDDGPLYKAMGYVLASERDSGLTRDTVDDTASG